MPPFCRAIDAAAFRHAAMRHDVYAIFHFTNAAQTMPSYRLRYATSASHTA